MSQWMNQWFLDQYIVWIKWERDKAKQQMTYFIELNKAKEETRVIDDETSGIVTNQ